MPKTKISEYSATNSANTDIEGINIDEGCPPSSINNAIRELMVHLKEFQTGASGDAFTFAGGTLMSGTNTISGAAVISGNINSSGTANTFSGGVVHSGTNTFSSSVIISGNISSSGTTNTFSGGNILSGTNTFSGTNIFSSDVTLNAQSDLRFADSDSSNWVALQAPATVASNVTWTLPATDGTSNQVLATNGSGTLSWATAGGGASISAGDSKVEVTDTGSNGTIVFNTDNAERMRVDASGNVGIGVTPSAWSVGTALQVKRASFYTYDNSGVEISQNAAVISGAWQRIGADFATKYGQDNGNHYWYTAASSTAGSAITWSERMRIGSNGAPDFFFSNDSGLSPRSSIAAGASDNLITGFYSATTTQNGTASFAVRTNGNVVNTNNSYGALSDAKLKENVVDANSQWEDLKTLKVRNYNFKEGQTHTQIGVVAQEVELVSPGLVSESPDRDEEGNDLGTVTKSVNYSVLYMKSVKALQEAQLRIETLEAQNAAFETRLAALEAN